MREQCCSSNYQPSTLLLLCILSPNVTKKNIQLKMSYPISLLLTSIVSRRFVSLFSLLMVFASRWFRCFHNARHRKDLFMTFFTTTSRPKNLSNCIAGCLYHNVKANKKTDLLRMMGYIYEVTNFVTPCDP
jgi:hypothetical protein